MSNISDKRMDILHSCIKVFAKKGYYKSTIDDIANEAGVGKGTVYLYFAGKRELFEEMLKYMLCQYYNKINTILSQDETVENRIKNLIQFYRKNIKERSDLIQTVISGYDPITSDKSNEVEKIFKQKRKELGSVLSDFMEDGIKRGEIRENIDIYIASLSMFSTIENYHLDKLYGEQLAINETDDSSLVDFILDMLK